MKKHRGYDALRVIMILFVIFIHENPSIDKNGWVVMWWHSVVQCAVPVFFVLSAYFFFQKMERFTIEVYEKKLKTRLKTLLLPYIIWNCVPGLLVVAGNIYSILFRGKSTCDLNSFLIGLWDDGLWHIWWDKTNGMPFNSPLWYVRDLMVLCARSPVIFYLVKRWGIWWIALVSMLFVIGMHFPIGISVTGILFFSIGCMWSIKSLQICHLNCKKTIIILVALFVLSNFFEIEFLHQLFILGLAMLLIKLFGAVKSGWVEYVAQYTDSIFFVLAVHNIFILANVGKLLNRVFTGTSSWIIYWIAPFVTLTICIILHRTLKKIAPNLMNILCGGR